MTDESKVVPLLDAEETPPEVSAMLRHARATGAPSPEQVARMSAALSAAVGVPAAALADSLPALGSAPASTGTALGGASMAPAAATAKLAGAQAVTAKLGVGLLWKGAALAVGLAGAGAVTYGALTPDPELAPGVAHVEQVVAPAAVVETGPVAAEPAEASEPVVQPQQAPVEPVPAEPERRAPVKRAAKHQPPRAPAADVPSELSLMQRAEAQRAQPRALLHTLSELERLYPGGMLAQERDVLRIEALVTLGRSAAARRWAARMEQAHPGSPHLARVHALLADAP